MLQGDLYSPDHSTVNHLVYTLVSIVRHMMCPATTANTLPVPHNEKFPHVTDVLDVCWEQASPYCATASSRRQRSLLQCLHALKVHNISMRFDAHNDIAAHMYRTTSVHAELGLLAEVLYKQTKSLIFRLYVLRSSGNVAILLRMVCIA